MENVNKTIKLEDKITLISEFDDTVYLNDKTFSKLSVDHSEILESPKRINTAKGIEGELICSIDEEFDLQVDLNGELILGGFNVDEFSINDFGELINERE